MNIDTPKSIAKITPHTANKDISSENEPLIVASTLAKMLGVSKRTIWRFRSSGQIPKPVKIGHSTKWRKAEIQQWLADGCPAVCNN